ncbi:SGNH/GDSL hydrolase family protein [Nocardia cyriacigeorgica]|nr:SGNH/GDSL hydrolase family protein [Nocardia cyriacigeorgica]
MSSEEPLRQVPDELFRKVSARPERALPDALFGPPPTPPPAARTPETVPAGGRSGAVEEVVPEPPTEPPDAGDDGVKTSASERDSGEATAAAETSDAPSSGEAAESSVESGESVTGVAETVAESVDSSMSADAATASNETPLEPAVGTESESEGDLVVAEPGDQADTPVAATSDAVAPAEPATRPVLLVIADSLAYFGPEGGLPADHPRIWPNLVGAELDWDVELVARIGWTCRDGYWALIGDPRVWAAVPRAGAVVFAVGGMDSLPSPLPTALRELIRYVRPPAVRRGVRATYQWLQPKLSKLGRPVALPPKVSVSYLEQSREALAQLRPDLPVVAVLPSVHNCAAYGRVHRGRERAVRALRAWSERTSVPLVDLGEAVRENIFSDAANPDGIHWGWDGHTAVANAMVKTLQEVR